jgi:hypothetical protein
MVRTLKYYSSRANYTLLDIGRDALIALGSCGPLVKYLPYEDRVLRLVLLNNLLQLVDKNGKLSHVCSIGITY